MEKPYFSVVVASYNSSHTIHGCLESLRQQDFRGPFEVIVVDSSNDGTDRLVANEFPEVTLISCSTRKFPGEARNLGVARASADIVCFLDSDCVANPGWLTAIRDAHALPDPVVGGCVQNGAARSAVGWASYFAEFSQWMLGMPRRRMTNIPTCNLTFKRWILDEMGPFGHNDWGEDTAYNLRLCKAGYPQPLFEPGITITHRGITDLGRLITHQLELGIAYGRTRVAIERFGVGRRVAYTLAIPLIHLLLFLRTTLSIVGNRLFIPEFIRSSPLVFLGLLAWSVGEGLGYAVGVREDHQQ